MLSASQEKLRSYFENAAGSDSLRQCYIICGESGIGKKHLAAQVKKYIMCDTHTACGSCNSCLSLDKGANADCITLSRGDKKTVELKKIRDMIKEAYIKPVGSKYKLFVIEDAIAMDTAAQNAILKLIEEPPSYAVFIFLADNLNTILPTILSRSLVLRLDNWSVDDLKAVCPLGTDKNYMYTYCLGNVGRLISLAADEDFNNLRNGVIDSFSKLIYGDDYAVYDAVDFWMTNKEYKDTLINILIMFIRDIVLFKASGSEQTANIDKLADIEGLSAKITLNKGFEMLKLANDAPNLLGRYGNFGMLVQKLMIQLKETQKG